MSSTASVVNIDNKEILNLITATLPNIGSYFKLVLKKEKLSDEAEIFRKKYDSILSSLEQGHTPGGRPISIVADDDSGYYSSNRIRAVDISDPTKQPFVQNHSGYLLWQDEKLRWRRCWCRAEYHNTYLYIYDDSNEEVLLKSFSLENTSTKCEDQCPTETDLERENSFVISGVIFESSISAEANTGSSHIDVHFAAYTDSERRKWTEVLQMVSSVRDSGRLSLSTLDGHSWVPSFVAAVDTTSSSSNLSSNRDSMVSNSSSLMNRMSVKTDIGENVKDVYSDDKTISTKQQQPLPCPPDHQQIESQYDKVPVQEGMNGHKGDDSGSVGTIYESIDNLVSQFDDAIRQIGENMRSGNAQGLSKKKKDHSLFRQHSFLLPRPKSTKSKLLTDKKAELEKGERYSGYMMRKTNTGSWKKRWCVLKGCVFGYYKSQNDTNGHEYVLLNGNVEEVSEGKKNFTFCLHCKGVPDMYFSMDEEDCYHAWVEKLHTACNSASAYAAILHPEAEYSVQSVIQESAKFADSIYSVPRTLTQGGGDELYDVPRGSMAIPSAMSADAAIDAGIYSVPRALMEGHLETESACQDESQSLLQETFNIYNFPRASISPDEEGIYDDPLDIMDMEIYDYPPDAAELGIDTSEYNAYRNSSVSAASSDVILSDSCPTDQPKVEAVPPIPRTSRPRLQNSDQTQSIRSSVMSSDSIYDHPRPRSENVQVEPLSTHEDSIPDSLPMKLPDPSLEYGQCARKGFLYKKERFVTWVKLFCVIRNNFLECHKYQDQGTSYSPVLKLFLPRSEVIEGGGDAKRKWAFQVKHPRREGVLAFAAENKEDCQQWIKAFQDGASIQVQPVNTVDEMRITDLDMQKHWTSEKGEDDLQNEASGLLPRCSTYSAGSASDDYSSDTLKRRRKFNWIKSNFMRRKTEKKMSYSQSELSSRLSNISFDIPFDTKEMDPLRKSVSLEILPSAIEGEEMQASCPAVSEGTIQGYLRIQRKGADNTWVRYWCALEKFQLSCYISQRDLTLTLSIDLHGSRISYADAECLRPHSFKIFHPDSGQSLFLAAEDNNEFMRWFSEVTKKGREVISDDCSTNTGPFASFFELPMKVEHVTIEKQSISEDDSSVSETSSMASLVPLSTDRPHHTGVLMKASHTGKWKKRCCLVDDGILHISRSFNDKVPIITLPLQSCSLELLSVSSNSQYSCQFKLKSYKSEKSHTFAALNEPEMYSWIGAIRKASCEKAIVSERSEDDNGHGNLGSVSTKRKSTKLNDAELVSHVPAASISSPDHAGYAYVQFGTEPWSQFWCIADNNCLYIYTSKTSPATVKTVVLPGYKVGVRELHSMKYANNLVLKHDGVSPVWLAFSSNTDLEKWADIFFHYSRAEEIEKQRKLRERTQSDTSHQRNASVGVTTKGPMKSDNFVNPRRKAKEKTSVAVNSQHGKPSKDKVQRSIIHRYEKRIRKTQRVANSTELILKKQQASLLHFKKELSRHITKLDELSSSGNEDAKKRLRDVKLKISQVDKIVPYLEKYVAVNRQAELQTISVLKETCTMELRQHGNVLSPGGHKGDLRFDKANVSVTPSEFCITPSECSPDISNTSLDHPTTVENPYATLSEVRKEVAETYPKVQSNYAELNFSLCKKSTALRPPSVNYVEVQILSGDRSTMKSQVTDSQNSSGQTSFNVTLEGNEQSTDTILQTRFIGDTLRHNATDSEGHSLLCSANQGESHLVSCKDPEPPENVVGLGSTFLMNSAITEKEKTFEESS